MTTALRTFSVRAIDRAVVDTLRVGDDLGRATRAVVDAEGGAPLRCCLQPSRPGETILLVSYAPLRRWAAVRGVDPGAYDEVGPVFIHAEACNGPADDGFPTAFRAAPRMLRAYRGDGSILRAVPVAADGPFEATIDALFADPEVAVVHARAVEFGCFTFAIERRA